MCVSEQASSWTNKQKLFETNEKNFKEEEKKLWEDEFKF